MKQCSVLPQDILIAGAIFNLGYLPNEEKTIIPTSETTLITIIEILPQLKKGYGSNLCLNTLSNGQYRFALRLSKPKKTPLLIAIEKNKKRNGGWPSFLLISI